MSASIFDFPSFLPNEEVLETLVQARSIRIERIISTGQTTPLGQWYDQAESEWVILLQGMAKIAYEDGTQVQLKAGDYLLILPHQKHRVEFTTADPPCIWLAIHYTQE